MDNCLLIFARKATNLAIEGVLHSDRLSRKKLSPDKHSSLFYLVMKKKTLNKIDVRCQCFKTFFFFIRLLNKLESLSLASLSSLV